MYIIGTIRKPTGVTLTDSKGNDYPETAPIPGHHVNTTKKMPGWDAYEVFPVTPQAVYAGAVTYYYTFADKAEFETICPPEPV